MKKFAQLLSTLYFTYSHLDKMTVIQQFFKETADPERGYALAIMANTLVFPTFKRSLIKELMQEKVDPVLFELSYDYVGDMSETVALLWPEFVQEDGKEHELPPLSVIISNFNSLPKDQIKAYLGELLNQCNATERWALLKLGTSSLRIGISTRFLKKTLAEYGHVTIQQIEKIWHGLEPPYIDLFAWLEKKTPEPVVSENIFFHPIMLSHPLEEKDIELINPQEFSFERKYDGIRVQVVSTTKGKALFTRTGENISGTFPDLLELIQGDVVLDGELIVHTSTGIGSFNQLQQRLNRKTPSKKLFIEFPAGLIVYDILAWNQTDLTTLTFKERRKKLSEWVETFPSNKILLSELLTIKNNQTLHQLKEQILAENHAAVEGVMIKRNLSPYIVGRPKGHWFKWKRNPFIIDAVLMYAQRGHGIRSSFYSDFTFGLWQNEKLLPIGKAYSGFTDKELVQLDRWVRHNTIQRFGPVREVEKKLVFEVAFDAVNLSTRHKSGLALRFPRINRIRWDKPAVEADQLDTLMQLL
ncbi:Putative DNA ligase-like protein Rv0938/MT0965 [Legionella beliardensis]|uniref:DNA ligase (ATP) n=1 Tax=Legionella beliardensis TaxID=91822 RepID=A0A378I583_9GAMM|nr:cisplatin damage response ATP-dependent DNA ligase [Legionella beliardensis]STX29831.1 Putative DNA ligase-like protein Rv0938/MT0965 [Legionella beliardensis]